MSSEESFVYTACPGWGDHDYCAIKTIVKDGKIVRTEKAVYTGDDVSDSHICQKGILSCRQPYNPDRLTKPLKRKEGTPRGGGEWEEISWDQALDEIGTKLNEIRDKHGAESVVIWSLAAGVPPAGGLGSLLCNRFTSLFGSTNPIMGLGLDNGPIFASFYSYGDNFLYVLMDPQVMIGADHIIVWGANPVENQMRGAMSLVKSRELGAKIVDIGLIYDATAGLADEFVGVAPGSDGWLALAMANYIVQNNLQDNSFLRTYTVAAYLVNPNTGKLCKDADGNYCVWDEKAGALAKVAPGADSAVPADAALLGSYDVGGVQCKTAYQILVDHLASYTLEEAEEITRVPAATIVKLAEEYAAAEKATIVGALGMRYKNQGDTYRALVLLGALTGNVGKQGACVFLVSQFSSYPIALNDAPISMPHGADGVKTVPVHMEKWFTAASGPNSPYKAFFSPAGNPVHQQPDRNRWLKIFDQMELVVDYDIWMTDTGELCDYVLPDCMPFERLEIISPSQYNHIVLQEPAIDPPAGCRPPTYLWTELAKRVGLGEYFDKTDEEWLALRLDNKEFEPIATLDPPLTWDRLKKEKMVRVNNPEQPRFDAAQSLKFMTPTGRIEFYVERLADLGAALPRYTPCFECPVIDGNEKFPYQLFTGRQRFFMQSMFTDDPINVEMSGGEPYTRINPLDAADKGLKDGDKVEVYNDRGHVVTKLELDESIPQGTLHVWFGWRRKHFEEGTYAECVTPISAPGVADEISWRWIDDFVDNGGIFNAGVDQISSEVGGWDAYWDCAADIRKWDGAAVGKGA